MMQAWQVMGVALLLSAIVAFGVAVVIQILSAVVKNTGGKAKPQPAENLEAEIAIAIAAAWRKNQ